MNTLTREIIRKLLDESKNSIKEPHIESHKIIAVDCDGTLFENEFPELGEPNRLLFQYLITMQEFGAKIILWTCRVDDKLIEVVEACTSIGLTFDAVNENLPDIIEQFGSDSRKIFAHEYIDDRACTRFNLPFVSNVDNTYRDRKSVV